MRKVIVGRLGSGRTLSARERWVLLGGGCAVALILLLGRGIPLLLAWEREQKAEVAEALAALARSRALHAIAPALTDSLHSARQRLARWHRELVPSASLAVASAALTTVVREAAEDAEFTLSSLAVQADTGMNARSVRALGDRDAATGGALLFTRLRLTAQGHGDITAVALLLAALEGDRSLLHVVSLNLNVRPDASAMIGTERLSTTIVVETLVATPSKSDRPQRQHAVPPPSSTR